LFQISQFWKNHAIFGPLEDIVPPGRSTGTGNLFASPASSLASAPGRVNDKILRKQVIAA
jgi:hypothetical protein